MADHNLPPEVIRLGLPDSFVEHGTPEELYHIVGLDAEAIKKALSCEKENVYFFMHQCLAPDAEKRHRIRNSQEVHALLAGSEKNLTVIQGHYHYGANAVIDGVKSIPLPALCVNDTLPYMILDTDLA